jgi:hypothetical protein
MGHTMAERRFIGGRLHAWPARLNKFQNGMGGGACLILKTGPDPVLKRSFCHLLANGLISGAGLFE